MGSKADSVRPRSHDIIGGIKVRLGQNVEFLTYHDEIHVYLIKNESEHMLHTILWLNDIKFVY